MVILSDNFYFNCNYTEDKGLFYKIYVKILKILFVYLRRTQIRSNNTQPNQLCQSIKIPLKKKSLFSPNTLNFPLIAHVISDIQCKKSKKNHDFPGKIKKKKQFYKNFIPWRPFSELAYIKPNVDCFERFVRGLARIYPTGMEEKRGERARGKIGTRTVRLQWIA